MRQIMAVARRKGLPCTITPDEAAGRKRVVKSIESRADASNSLAAKGSGNCEPRSEEHETTEKFWLLRRAR